jgi:hypothetical protein
MQNTRRKLIKGALGATVVTVAGCGGGGGSGGDEPSFSRPGAPSGDGSAFTVPRGSGWAGGSTACYARDLKQAEYTPPAAVSDAEDTWMRGELEFFDLQANGKQIDGEFFLGADQHYWRLELGGESAVSTEYTPLTVQASSTGYRQVLLQLDESGEIIGTALEPNGGIPMTRSCWHSIKPRTI